MFQDKLNRVLNAMKDAGLEQMIVADPASIYYLTGRMILPGERMLVTVSEPEWRSQADPI